MRTGKQPFPRKKTMKTVCHNCQDKLLSEFETETIRNYRKAHMPAHSLKVLDIGCGDSGDGQKIFADDQYMGIDETTGTDARQLPLQDNQFDAVLMKRILCQHGPVARAQIISEATRVCKPDGHVLVCEPWALEYGNINGMRVRAGLKPLPAPASGGNFLTDYEFLSLTLQRDEAIAPNYVYWTRFLYERLTGTMLDYGETVQRLAYPQMSKGVQAMDPYRFKAYRNG
jgi:SAM-dependent methyltransferase